ncbi:MAG: UDP-2,3-diacylglucosamine diphosphatase [Candidatus Cryosericum sp.]
MIYAISDLHLGDNGPRDNFAAGTHLRDFLGFLTHVETTEGALVICGDVFEFWQANVSRVLQQHICLLDRLADLQAIYIPGNHDADLQYFRSRMRLNHPFFDLMCNSYTQVVAGRRFHFVHGHAADPYCASDRPGIGRITAIYTGLAEDKHGSPMLDKYHTVEAKVLGPWEKLASVWGRLRGEPSRNVGINRRLRALYPGDVVVSGHTHAPGRIGDWHYNCGTWAERVNSFVRIADDGTAQVFDWADGHATPNPTELPY